MPKRTDLKKILVIGSGPIVIGQAAEFDYAGTQACLALKEEGYEVVLCNSNPATIMTDTMIADKVYMEPLTLEYIARIVRYERPDAIIPGIGGQTGLNLAMQLEKKGVLKECGVELLGTPSSSIEQAEDRELFKERNIVRSLNARGCDVTVVPWDITAEEVENLRPDGVFISNGPGNPEDAAPVIALVKTLRGKYPIFGICLGHQIIALSYGAKTYKLKFGHRGGNHPVKNLQTGKVEITSQNHSYAVDAGSLADTGLAVTHVNLLDNTVEGLKCRKDRIFSVQYHPESAPGPQDSAYLFDEFTAMMEGK